ncbi:MAG: pyruvate ferredoxin oxidoreductase, partial [Methanosarcinaceae archaeon]
GALCTETKACLYNTSINMPVVGFMIGHGGRDIRMSTIESIVEQAKKVADSGVEAESQFADLKEELL